VPSAIALAVLLLWMSGCSLSQSQQSLAPAGQRDIWWAGFAHPFKESAPQGLTGPEQHIAGKIPIVFIHGLLSSPSTWDPAIKALRADAAIADRYEFWLYQYPTGQSYLTNAANLRADLRSAVADLDPKGTDPELQQMVLIGHSMGGLIAKLEVTQSEQTLWNSISLKSPDDLRASPEVREQIEQTLFFEPLPFVNRVIFIGTPHGGSEQSDRFIGRFARSLVNFPKEMVSSYSKLVNENRDILRTSTGSKPPTSVEELSPGNPILQATRQLPIAPAVHVHSIIGTGYKMPDGTPGDGVVALTSAQLLDAESELTITTRHTNLQSDPATIREILRLLTQETSDTR